MLSDSKMKIALETLIKEIPNNPDLELKVSRLILSEKYHTSCILELKDLIFKDEIKSLKNLIANL